MLLVIWTFVASASSKTSHFTHPGHTDGDQWKFEQFVLHLKSVNVLLFALSRLQGV